MDNSFNQSYPDFEDSMMFGDPFAGPDEGYKYLGFIEKRVRILRRKIF